MKRILTGVVLMIPLSFLWAQDFYVGTTMGFTDYLENRCGIVYKEDGVAKDPFLSLADHGANIVRLRIDHPPYSSSYSNGEIVDHKSVESVKVGMQRANNAGLKTLLTFGYTSWALEDDQRLNPYVAPLAWQSIADNLDKITDSVYTFTYEVLDEYCSEGLIPEIVSIGNESTWHRLMPNVPENELPEYDPARSVALHNAGAQAVRDISSKYSTSIQVCFHMMKPSQTKWWLEEHSTLGLNCDIIGISLYHGWNQGDYAGFSNLGAYVEYITSQYKLDLLVMETAQMFRPGGNDDHVDILGTVNIPEGYPNPPTTDTQKDYLTDIALQVKNNGGLGVIVWGGEWVGCDCFIYADQWGKGSSWENKAFWDFDYNLHDGVNWMRSFGYMVPVTFNVDMTGVDVSNGVFVTGEFPNAEGETWKMNPMTLNYDNVYSYSTEMEVGAAGSYFFLNDDNIGSRESVPEECVEYWGLDRGYKIPAGSTGETFSYIWSSCDVIQPVSISNLSSPEEFFFEMYPNPSQDNELNLIFSVDDRVDLSIINTSGQIAYSKEIDCYKNNRHMIELKSLRKGVYFLRAYFNELNLNQSRIVLLDN